jgi:hypothetical protein
LTDMIDALGIREVLRFIGSLVRDGVILPEHGRRAKAEACRLSSAMVA